MPQFSFSETLQKGVDVGLKVALLAVGAKIVMLLAEQKQLQLAQAGFLSRMAQQQMGGGGEYYGPPEVPVPPSAMMPPRATMMDPRADNRPDMQPQPIPSAVQMQAVGQGMPPRRFAPATH